MKELINKGFSYLDYLIAPPLKEIGGIFGDTIGLWRYRNLIRIEEKVKKIHDSKGIKPREIPLKTFASLINHASFEEQEQLVDMWAALLANATNPNNDINFHNVFVKILSELSAPEAKLLNSKAQGSITKKNVVLFSLREIEASFNENSEDEKGKQESRISFSNSRIILNNLTRLGLIESTPSRNKFTTNSYFLTELGKAFILECSE